MHLLDTPLSEELWFGSLIWVPTGMLNDVLLIFSKGR